MVWKGEGKKVESQEGDKKKSESLFVVNEKNGKVDKSICCEWEEWKSWQVYLLWMRRMKKSTSQGADNIRQVYYIDICVKRQMLIKNKLSPN